MPPQLCSDWVEVFAVETCFLGMTKVFAMLRTKWICGLCAGLLAVSLVGEVQAQQRVPTDVNKPHSDAGIPELLTGVNSLIRNQDAAELIFDSLLNPVSGQTAAAAPASVSRLRA